MLHDQPFHSIAGYVTRVLHVRGVRAKVGDPDAWKYGSQAETKSHGKG